MFTRFDQSEERIRKPEDRTIEMIKSEEQKEKKNEEKLTESKGPQFTIQRRNIHIMGGPQGGERERGRKNI